MRNLFLVMFFFVATLSHAVEAINPSIEEVRPDLAGKKVEETVDNVKIERSYDDNGVLVRKLVRDPKSELLYIYDMQGRLVQLVYPDKTQMVYQYADDKSLKPFRTRFVTADGKVQEQL